MALKKAFIVSCIYTAEYGAIVVDYQNVYPSHKDALDSIMSNIGATYEEVGGENIYSSDLHESIRTQLIEHGEHRKDWGNGNQYLWTVVEALLEVEEKEAQ